MGGRKERNNKQRQGKEKLKQRAPFKTESAEDRSKMSKKALQLLERTELETLLKKKGMQIQEIPADGNCMFRSLSFLLHGWADEDHLQMRTEVCQHMEDNKDFFAPFVEDDEGFDAYLGRMRKDGTWGSQMELCAAQQSIHCALHIYQPGKPCYVLAAPSPSNKLVLSLHFDGVSHYNAIYSLDDTLDAGKLGRRERTGAQSSSSTGEGEWKGGRKDSSGEAKDTIVLDGSETDTGDGDDGAAALRSKSDLFPPRGKPGKESKAAQWADDEGFMMSKKEAKKLARAQKKSQSKPIKELENGMQTIFL